MVESSLFQRLWLGLRGTAPLVLSLLLVLLSVLPYGIADFAAVRPALAMIAVYYWSIYRPDLLPAPAAFLIGVVQDVLAGTPLGMTALVLLLMRAVIISQRKVFVGESFLVGWWGFAIIAAGAALLTWLLASAWFLSILAADAIAYQTLITVMLYPLFAWIFGRLQRRVLSGV